ncbi:insulinase family protein [Candidatus Similichlamydia epinepheli]|uniref:insulinase family protein n=1 Tax=Candidatus Similichlamydia epinepheli TaxID=1903953 RepID=UPI0013007DAE|nr:insulinase family protein [Candidatus Similichlamydia epinepheli]
MNLFPGETMRFVHVFCCFCPILLLRGGITPSHGSCFGSSLHSEIPFKREYSYSNELKNRQESRIRLRNGTSLVLISDPLADQCDVVLAVASGYASPKSEVFGLAHVLTHTLFLNANVGQKPLLELLKQKKIYLESSVREDHTLYYLSTSLPLFEESIDLFSTALLNPGIRSEELKLAKQEISLEHAERLQSDQFRIQWTREEVYSPEHSLHQSSLGKETDLSRITTEILKNWHRKNYTGERLFVVVKAPLTVEQMQPMLISCFERFPESIDQQESPINNNYISPYRGQEPSLLYVCTQRERILELEWTLPARNAQEKLYERSAEELIAELLLHKAKGGLVSILRECGFVEDIDYSLIERPAQSELPRQFRIRAFLTKKGTKEWSMVLSEILLGLSTIVEKVNIDSYAQEEFNARQAQYLLKEGTKSRESCFQILQEILIGGLSYCPDEQICSTQTYELNSSAKSRIITQQDPLLITLACPVDEWNRAHDGLKEKEAWLHVHSRKKANQFQWLFRNLPELPKASLAKNLLTPPKNVLLLQPNKKTPSTNEIFFEPVDISGGTEQFYYCSDTLSSQPVGHWQIFLALPDPSTSPGSAAGAELFQLCVSLLEEATRSVTYLARKAGITIKYQLITPRTMSIFVSGPCEQSCALVESILQGLSQLTISEETFNLAKKRRIQSLNERCFFVPERLSLMEMESILFDGFSLEQRIDDLNELSFHQATYFLQQVKDLGFAKGCYFGKDSKSDIEIWWKRVSSIGFFDTNRRTALEGVNQQEIRPKEEQILYSLEPGNACSIAISLGNYSAKSSVKQWMLTQLIESLLERDLIEDILLRFSVQPFTTDKRLYLTLTTTFPHSPFSKDRLLSFLDVLGESLLKTLSETPLLFEESKIKTLHQLRRPIQEAQIASNLLAKKIFLETGISNEQTSLTQEAMALTHQEIVHFIKENLLKETRQAFFIQVQGIPSDQKETVLQRGRPNWCQFNLLKQ